MKLKEWLTRENKSPAEFGAEIGIGTVSVYRYINGERTPRKAIMAKIVARTNGEVTAADFYADAPAGAAA